MRAILSRRSASVWGVAVCAGLIGCGAKPAEEVPPPMVADPVPVPNAGGQKNRHLTVPIVALEKTFGKEFEDAGRADTPQIVIVSRDVVSPNKLDLQMVLVNPLTVPIEFWGHSVRNPLGRIFPHYTVQIQWNEKWREWMPCRSRKISCGGSETTVIPPRQAGHFEVFETLEYRSKIAISVTWKAPGGESRSMVVFSPELDPAETNP